MHSWHALLLTVLLAPIAAAEASPEPELFVWHECVPTTSGYLCTHMDGSLGEAICTYVWTSSTDNWSWTDPDDTIIFVDCLNHA